MARRTTKQKNSKSSKRSTKKRGSSWLLKFIKTIFFLGLLAGISGLTAVAGIFYYYGRDLPELLSRDDFDPPQVTRIYASNGELISELFKPGGRRTVMPLEDIPIVVQHAFMAAEDADFMVHSGVDFIGIARAFYNAIKDNSGMRATSTITQQVVKNLILTPERKLERKIKEILLALQLEKNLTKEDILFLYLNTMYLGHGTNGVEEAARFYFGKSITDVNIPEAALLAGLTQSPERLTPHRHPERALARRGYVLRQLWEKGFIEEASYRSAEETPIELAKRQEVYPHIGKAPYFVEHVRKELIRLYGEDKTLTGGLRVYTTLNLAHQEAAEKAARAGLRDYDDRRKFYRPIRQLKSSAIDKFLQQQEAELPEHLRPNDVYEAVVMSVDTEDERVYVRIGKREGELSLVPRARILGESSEEKALNKAFSKGDVLRVRPTITSPSSDVSNAPLTVEFEPGPEVAVISINPHTREITAWVGGYDFDTNKFDHVVQARRQTGSSFKSIVFAAALEDKIITPATIYLDSPSVFQMPDDETWSPRNSDGDWRGPVRVREGLGASRNVVAVRVLHDIGIKKAKEFAEKIGIKSALADNYTLVMGSSEIAPLEITNAYATFAANGNFGEPLFLTKVESPRGEQAVFSTQIEPVIAPEVAYLTTSLLESAVHGYVDQTGRRRVGTGHTTANIGHRIAGKTGTTNDSRDAWFIGYTPDVVTGVWVGFDDNRSLGSREYGGRVAAPIFRDFMKAILDGQEPTEFQEPEMGISTANIDPSSGKLARTGGIEEIFLVGTAPTEYAPQEDEGSAESFFLDQFQ